MDFVTFEVSGIFGSMIFVPNPIPFFSQNEKNLPLNELHLPFNEDGVKRKLPALVDANFIVLFIKTVLILLFYQQHEKWKESRCFTKYASFPMKNGLVEEGAGLDQWLSETEWFVKDLEWLLGLEHFR